MTAGLLLGLLVGNTLRPDPATLARAAKAFISIAIVLVGLRIRLGDVAAVGLAALGLASLAVTTGVATALLLGRALGVERDLSSLIAVGTGICGNTAILAAAPLLRAGRTHVVYAVATVTAFGTLAILAFPLVGEAVGMSDRTFGLWAGAGVHDTSQVLATGFSFSDEAGETATIVKLVRNALLAPVLLAIAYLASGRTGEPSRSTRLPWFVWAFVGAVFVGSLDVLPSVAVYASSEIAHTLIVFGIAAIGAGTDVRSFRSIGGKPFVLGLVAMAAVSAAVLLSVGLTTR